MRASATSRTASPANHFASQAKADANKADSASPFSLLVASVAPKDAAKPPLKDASSSQDQAQDHPSDPAQDSQAADTPTATPPQSAATPTKPEKTGKDKGATSAKAGNDTGSGTPAAAALLPQLPQQSVPPQPDQQTLPPQTVPAQVQPPAAPGAGDHTDTLPVGAAAPANAAPATPPAASAPAAAAPAPPAAAAAEAPVTLESGVPNPQPGTKPETKSSQAPAAQADSRSQTQTPAISQPKPAAPSQTPVAASGAANDASDDQDVDSQPVTSPAPTAIPVAADSSALRNSGKTAGPTPSSIDNGAPVANAENNASKTQQSDGSNSHASASGVQHADPGSAAAPATLPNPGQDDGAKNGIVSNGAPKTRTVSSDAGGKAEIGKSDPPKSDAPKSAASMPDVQTGAPKSAASTPAPAAIAAVNTIAAPQALSSPAAAATANPHIQVSAQAAPDLPALAVEIVAKSQSGARQFDIRLDPPELGRVEVRLSIDATGKASAHLSADQPQTLSLLQKDAPILARALRDAGLDVSQNGLNFSLRQQGENSGGNAATGGGRTSSRGFPLAASLSIDAAASGGTYQLGLVNGRLDIRV